MRSNRQRARCAWPEPSARFRTIPYHRRMPGVPVICDRGHLFDTESVGAIALGPNVSGATFSNVQVGPCPYCGTMGRVQDGTYDVVAGKVLRRAVTAALREIVTPGVTLDELRAIRAALEDFKSTNDEESLKDRVSAEAPAAARAWEWMKSPAGIATSMWITTLVAVLTLLIALKTASPAKDPSLSPSQIENIVGDAVHQLQQSAPALQHAPTDFARGVRVDGGRRPKGGAPCPCGSRKQYKNCHGRRDS
jgi:hypothetical protein